MSDTSRYVSPVTTSPCLEHQLHLYHHRNRKPSSSGAISPPSSAMFVRDVLLPRSILVNAALYAVIALLYTIIFFALETSSPGTYVFSNSSNLDRIFSYLVICSWPILLFGALTLIAVRVGGNVRRRRRRRRRKKRAKSHNLNPSTKLPPSTTPPNRPSHKNSPTPPPPTSPFISDSFPEKPINRNSSAARSKRSTATSKTLRVEKGFVSVTPSHRIFAALGFLWVSVGLACSAAAAILVFFGQRERLEQEAERLGTNSEQWKPWVIPILCGILMAVVFTILSVTTLLKVFSTIAAKGREIQTPAHSENDASSNDLDDPDMLFVDGEPTAPPLTPAASAAQPRFPAPPAPVVRGRARMGNPAYHPPHHLPYQPDQKTVDRLMRQLRDMGFPNPHQNLAALQASSFDLERASDKLVNAQIM